MFYSFTKQLVLNYYYSIDNCKYSGLATSFVETIRNVCYLNRYSEKRVGVEMLKLCSVTTNESGIIARKIIQEYEHVGIEDSYTYGMNIHKNGGSRTNTLMKQQL